MLKIKANIDRLNTEERRVKASLIVDEMRIVLNSENLKNKILRITEYDGELSKWKGATITAIYSHIMSGAEVLDPEVDYEMDLFVDDYYTPTNTVGKTYPNDKFIYTNTNFFDTNSTKRIGSNFFHEWGHKLGFAHDYKDTPRRKRSLCYLMNRAYEEAWEDIFGEPSENDKVMVCERSWRTLFLQRCRWVKVQNSDHASETHQ